MTHLPKGVCLMKIKNASLVVFSILIVGASFVSADAEELKLITDGKLAAETIEWQGKPTIGSDADKFVFGGRGVRLWAKKAALGDCELKATLSFDSFTHGHRDAAVVVQDWGPPPAGPWLHVVWYQRYVVDDTRLARGEDLIGCRFQFAGCPLRRPENRTGARPKPGR